MKTKCNHWLVLLAGLLLAAAAQAQTVWRVTTLEDGPPGSLRDRIASAKAGDIINFNPSNGEVPLTGTIQLTNVLNITTNLTITGSSLVSVIGQANSPILPGIPPPYFSVFNIASGATVTISGLTISNGYAFFPSQGGGIYNAGNLTLQNCTISDNIAQTDGEADGGGIYSSGPLTLLNCTISGNTAQGGGGGPGFGGGIYSSNTLTLINCLVCSNTASGANYAAGGGIEADGTLTLTNCTVSFNSIIGGSLCNGGGIDVDNSNTNPLVNCTIAGNSLTGVENGRGGGISDLGMAEVALTSCTISRNDAGAGSGEGGGIFLDENVTCKLENTIVAGNIAGTAGHAVDDLAAGESGSLVSGGFNLIGNGEGAYGPVLLASDQVGTAAQPLDPVLGPLQDNGGPTPTMAPTAASVKVIDQGTNCSIPFDQRGLSRPFLLNHYPLSSQAAAAGGDGSDIGAVELSSAPPSLTLSIVNPGSVVISWPVSTNLFANSSITNIFYNTVAPSDYGIQRSPYLNSGIGGNGGSGIAHWEPLTRYPMRIVNNHYEIKDDLVDTGGVPVPNAFWEANSAIDNPFVPPPVTGPAINITATTATLTGTNYPAGSNTVYWFDYGTDTNYGWFTMTNGLPTTTNPTPVSVAIPTVLMPSITYYYQLMASDSDLPGLQYGGPQSFTTLAPPPSSAPGVTTSSATLVTSNGPASYSAVLNGTVNPEGGPTMAWFYYQYTFNGSDTFTGQTTPQSAGTNSSPSLFNQPIYGLPPNITCYFEIAASNSAGISYGGTYIPFSTTSAYQPAPTVTTLAASSVTTNSAVLNGNVNPNGADTQVWFEWGTTTAYGNSTPTNDIGFTAYDPYTAALNGLSSSATYHYRVDATNSGGITLGPDVSFTNLWGPVPPTLLAPGVNTAAGPTVTNLTPLFTWTGASQASYFNLTISQSPYGSGNTVEAAGISGGLTAFQVPNGILQPGTAYAWNMVSFDSLGDESASSASLYFQTPMLPTVTTLAATNVVGSASVILNGNVNPNGSGTEVYFEYGLTTVYGLFTAQTNIGTAAGIYSANISGLESKHTYNYRVDAVNGVGTSYGTNITFIAQ